MLLREATEKETEAAGSIAENPTPEVIARIAKIVAIRDIKSMVVL